MIAKRSFRVLFGTVVLVGAFAQAGAAVEDKNLRFDTTKDLAQVCSVTPDQAEYALTNQACRAFIKAAVQYHDEVTGRKNLKRLICYPKGATIEDGRAAFVAWAAKHAGDAKRMDEVPVVGLVRALADKYPCKG